MNIRNATKNDIRKISEIDRVSFGIQSSPEDEFQQFFEAKTDNENLIVIESETNEIAGFIGFTITNTNEMQIWNLAIDKNQRRKGNALLLIDFACKKAIQMKCKQIILKTSELSLPAITLFESIGFEKIGTIPKHYLDGSSAVVYQMTLRPELIKTESV